jgi:hypothetical protein
LPVAWRCRSSGRSTCRSSGFAAGCPVALALRAGEVVSVGPYGLPVTGILVISFGFQCLSQRRRRASSWRFVERPAINWRSRSPVSGDLKAMP